MRLNPSWIAALAACLAANAARAAVWTQPSGSTANFTYANGGDTNGLYGDPTVTARGFSFTPPNFLAQSSNGGPGPLLSTDRLSVDITATPASGGIKSIKFSEAGDYSIFNGGGVFVQAYLLVQDLDTGFSYSKLLTPTPTMPQTGGAGAANSGAWSGTLALDFGGKSLQHFRIVLNNILQAYSNPGGSALIQKKAIGDPNGPGIELTGGNVPEPTTLAALGGLVTLVVVRRKR